MQAFEDAQARYVDACAPIIAQAYHDGDYDGFWQALSNATHTDNFIYYKNAAFQIIEQTIILTVLFDHDISDGALHDTSFMRAVARDTMKNSDDRPNGVHRLFGRLYDRGDFNALKTSNPSFTAARNAVALGSRIMEELANTVTNDEELINNALKLCAPTGLAEHAYLAGADNSDDNILSRIGRKNFHETTGNFMVTSASYGIVYALCGDVQGAAAKWRSIINRSESGAQSHVAQYAHMMITVTLLVYHNTITADDLATLIDTFQEHEDAHPDRNMRRIGFYVPEAPSYPITTVEQAHRLRWGAHARQLTSRRCVTMRTRHGKQRGRPSQ